MDKFTASDLAEFLRAVDRALTAPCSVILIGGAVVALRYQPDYMTRDVDLWNAPGAEFSSACVQARAATGKDVPVQVVGVAQPLHDFEDRLIPSDLGGAKLKVLLPEGHDLAIMKIARGYEHDLEAIAAIHRAQPLSLETLVERYRGTDVIGSREMFKIQFLDAISRLFGDDAARRLEPTLT